MMTDAELFFFAMAAAGFCGFALGFIFRDVTAWKRRRP
jgi:hypothetical protein